MIGIYKITSPTGKVYIGQSWYIEQRLYRYKHYLSSSYNQSVLHRSFVKYGSKNHIMDVLLQLTEDTNQLLLDYHEIRLIKEYKDAGIILLNVREGGQSIANLEVVRARSERRQNKRILKEVILQERLSKEKNRKEEKQKKLDELVERKRVRQETREERYKGYAAKSAETGKRTRERQKQERLLLPKVKKKVSLEGIEKTRLKNLGKKRTEEFKQRLSELKKGYIQSEETKQKISDIKKEYFQTHQVHNKGVKLHEEGRKILSDASTCKKPVLQYSKTGEFIKEWDFIKQAADSLGLKAQSITRVCKGGRVSSGNFIWKYKQ